MGSAQEGPLRGRHDGKFYISNYPHLWCFGPKEGQPAEARKKRLGNNLKWEDLRLLP